MKNPKLVIARSSWTRVLVRGLAYALARTLVRTLARALVVAVGSLGLVVMAPARLAQADTTGTSYLRAAAILLDESRRSTDWMLTHQGDTELAHVLHEVSEARVRAGRRVMVPKELDRAHPHLLLVLETVERALDASTQGETKRVMQLVVQAREEEQTYRAAVNQLGFHLPEVERVERDDRPCGDHTKQLAK